MASEKKNLENETAFDAVISEMGSSHFRPVCM